MSSENTHIDPQTGTITTGAGNEYVEQLRRQEERVAVQGGPVPYDRSDDTLAFDRTITARGQQTVEWGTAEAARETQERLDSGFEELRDRRRATEAANEADTKRILDKLEADKAEQKRQREAEEKRRGYPSRW